jgi:hypothetical protein
MESGPARSIASLVALNGYLYMISDDVSLYTEEKLDIARKTMPGLCAAAAETGPLPADAAMNYYRSMLSPRAEECPLSFGNVWTTHFAGHGRSWAVLNLVCTAKDEEKASQAPAEIQLEKLGLDPSLQYAAFDFWKQEPLGFVKGKLRVDMPGYLDCRVLALTPITDGPELIGSSRHISMDAVSVLSVEKAKSSIKMTVKGPKGTQGLYWFAYLNEIKKMKVMYSGEEQEAEVKWP